MSAFSAEWLALREPADCRARARPFEQTLARWAADRTGAGARPLRIVDLACGTGANMRHLAPRLKVNQTWLLVDNDASLIRAAEKGVVAMPVLRPCINVTTALADLATVDLGALIDGADLITGSALFDLVSASWCERLAVACRRPGRALLATLVYNGQVAIDPADPLDQTILELFNMHQLTDKGFGPALGPTGILTLAHMLSANRARLAVLDSDWFLGPMELELQAALLAGLADAALAVTREQEAAILDWRARRLAAVAVGRPFVSVGHRDLLALWPSSLNGL